MIDPASTVLLEDLRFTLNVMEEDAHLGLDNATADKLKAILVRRISETEIRLGHRPASIVPSAFQEQKVSA